MIDVFFAMETGDPDDIFALLWIIAEQSVTLRGIAVSKGSLDQVGFLRWLLNQFNSPQIKTIPIGPVVPLKTDEKKGRPKSNLDKGTAKKFTHGASFDKKDPGDGKGSDLLYAFLQTYPKGTVITGAPLTVLRLLFEDHPDARIEKLVSQGGFAGSRCVKSQDRLDKFKDTVRVGTYNFNGDVRAANMVLASPYIAQKTFVSKDVCHGVAWTMEIDERVGKILSTFKSHNAASQSKNDIYIAWSLMSGASKKKNKKLHDPLAACVAVCPDICNFMFVRCYRERGSETEVDNLTGSYKWGSVPDPASKNAMSVSFNLDKFEALFLRSLLSISS